MSKLLTQIAVNGVRRLTATVKLMTMAAMTVLAAVTMLTSCTSSSESQTFDVDAALQRCDDQVRRALRQLEAAGGGAIDTTMMPRNVAPGDSVWTCRPVKAEEWCSGFWPGILWLDYESCHSEVVREAAIGATRAMQRIVDQPVLDHDLGFLVYCSAGTGLRVLSDELGRIDAVSHNRREALGETVTEDSALMALFSDLCLRAADSLATLFNPTVGTILSWPRNVGMFGGHNTIMDNMINLELLCWAARQDMSPRRKPLFDIAVRHAETTRLNHFREDATSYHVAVYDTLDGHFIHGVTHQGLADSSTWARGQAWAVYGFTMMARETRHLAEGAATVGDTEATGRGQKARGRRPKTGEHKLFRHGENKKLKGGGDDRDDKLPVLADSTSYRFLEQACRAADAFISRLPEDGIPFWDFDDPRIATSPQDRPASPSDSIAPRDASAAAVMASALLELSTLVAEVEDLNKMIPGQLKSLSDYYFEVAERMLITLSSDNYQAAPNSCAILRHSTGNLPAGSEIDVPIVYADYYYLEALLRYKALTQK